MCTLFTRIILPTGLMKFFLDSKCSVVKIPHIYKFREIRQHRQQNFVKSAISLIQLKRFSVPLSTNSLPTRCSCILISIPFLSYSCYSVCFNYFTRHFTYSISGLISLTKLYDSVCICSSPKFQSCPSPLLSHPLLRACFITTTTTTPPPHSDSDSR